MQERQGQDVEGKQNRLVEIYKLQSQLTNSISNRRTTANRFYIVLMSGLVFIFSALLQNKGKLPSELLNIVSIEQVIAGLGLSGLTLSWVWGVSINSYLRVNSRKYEELKRLEKELEYQFFRNEWELLVGEEKGKPIGKDRRLNSLYQPYFLFSLTC